MRKAKTVLLFVFILLLGLVCYPYVASKFKKAVSAELFGKFDFEKLNKVSIENSATPMVFAKQDGAWLVNGKTADLSKASELIEMLKNIKAEAVVSRNQSNFSKYGMDETAIKVTVESPAESKSIFVGKTALSFSRFYARASEGQTAKVVYLSSGSLPGVLAQSELDFRDKTVVNIKPGDIVKVETFGEKSAQWVKDEGESWKNVVNVFSPLLAIGFASADEKATFNSAAKISVVRIMGSDTKPLAELKVVETSGLYLVQPSGSTDVYEVDKPELDAIFSNS